MNFIYLILIEVVLILNSTTLATLLISSLAKKLMLIPFLFNNNNILPTNQEQFNRISTIVITNIPSDDIVVANQQNDVIKSYNDGNMFLMSGQFDKALIEFNKIIEASPNNADFYISRGIIYEKLFDWDKAIEDYQKANNIYKSTQLFHLNDDDPVAISNIGNALTGKLEWKEALKYFNYAAKLKPDYEAPLIGRALVQYQLGMVHNYITYIAVY